MNDIESWCSALLPSKNRRAATPIVYLAMRRNIELANDHPTACPSRFSDTLSPGLGKLGEEISRRPPLQQSTGDEILSVFYRTVPSVVDIRNEADRCNSSADMKMLSLKHLSTVSLLWAISTPLVSGQRTTYTGCHNHTEASSAVEYCYGPDGAETARATHALTGSASLPESVSASATAEPQTTAVTGCHSHETAVFCINGAGEEVHVEATPTGEVPPAYTGCHAHDTEMYGPSCDLLLFFFFTHGLMDTQVLHGPGRQRRRRSCRGRVCGGRP